ncbi:hypothetical protein Vretifemale_3527, partial [Volvox reticuliferus]
ANSSRNLQTKSQTLRQLGQRLVLLALAFASTLGRLGANLLEVLLQSSQILTGLRELTLLHTLTDIPVHERTLSIHQIELVVQAAEDLANSSAVGDHANCALHLGQISTWHNGGRLVVDAALKAGRAPVDELNGALRLDGGHGRVDVLWHHIAAVHQAAGHVLAVARVALDHHRGRLKSSVGDLSDRQLLMVSLLGRDDRGVGAEHKVDAGVWHQVSLELSHIHVEGTIEAQGSRQGADDLSNQAVQVGVGRALDVEAAAANVINSLVVEHDRHIGVLQQGVGRQDGVVWLNNSRRHLGRRVDSEAQLGLLAVVDRQALQQQRAKARASAATNSVENEEALQAGAVVGQLADTVQSEIHNFLADGVVTTGEVVGGILFAGNQL